MQFYLQILENTSISLRFKNLEASFPTDPLDHYYSSLFDVARIDGLLINHVDMFDDGITLRFDSDLEPTYSHNMVGSLKRTSSSGTIYIPAHPCFAYVFISAGIL